MAEQKIYRLVPSCNTYGHYALDEVDGPEISSGQVIAINIGALWIEGSIEHGENRYLSRGIHHQEEVSEYRTLDGYYFKAKGGGLCGLCAGMLVRLI